MLKRHKSVQLTWKEVRSLYTLEDVLFLGLDLRSTFLTSSQIRLFSSLISTNQLMRLLIHRKIQDCFLPIQLHELKVRFTGHYFRPRKVLLRGSVADFTQYGRGEVLLRLRLIVRSADCRVTGTSKEGRYFSTTRKREAM